MYAFSGLGASQPTLFSEVKDKIRSTSSLWRWYDVVNLRDYLNMKLAPLGYKISSGHGNYDPSLCAAVEALFGKNTSEGQELARIIGSACQHYTDNTQFLERLPGGAYTAGGSDPRVVAQQAQIPGTVQAAQAQQAAAVLAQPCPVSSDLRFSNGAFRDSVAVSLKAACLAGVKGEPCRNTSLGNRITAANYQQFLAKYGPCGLRMVPKAFVPCPVPPNACATSEEVYERSILRCDNDVTPAGRGEDRVCPQSSTVTATSAESYSPCDVLGIRPCKTVQMENWRPYNPEAFDQTLIGSPAEADGDKKTPWVMIAAGAVVLGGVVYFGMKGKKR